MSGPVSSTSNASHLTPLRLPRRIEVDLTVHGRNDTVQADGDIFLRRNFLPGTIRRAVSGVQELQRLNLGFDTRTQRYNVSADLHILGARIPVSASTAVRTDGPTIVLGDTRFNFPFSSVGFVSDFARDRIVQALHSQGIGAERDGSDIRISGTDVLREAEVLPRWAHLAPEQQIAVQHDPEGNVQLHFGNGPTGTPDGVSHVRAHLDRPASQRVLQDLFGRDYTVQGADFTQGQVEVHGTTRIQGVASAVNTLAGPVLALLGASAGTLASGNEPMSQDPTIGLRMTIRPEGNNLTITPDLRAAVQPVADALRTPTVQPTINGRTVSVSANALLPSGQVNSMSVDQEGIHADASLNIDDILNPELARMTE